MTAAPRLSLVIPCYNEAKSLPLLLERCRGLVTHGGIEVILVDNGSTDGTAAWFAENLPPGRPLTPMEPGTAGLPPRQAGRPLTPMKPGTAGLPPRQAGHPLTPMKPGTAGLPPRQAGGAVRGLRLERNEGYGAGILAGLRAAKGAYLGWTHADLQTDPLDAVEGLRLLEAPGGPTGAFIKGRRYGRPLGDVAFMAGMAAFETVLLRTPLWDINAQPNLFHRSFFESWQDPPSDFSLDLFAYYHAVKTGLTIRRFPVHFGKRPHGVSHWNADLPSKWKFIKRTLAFSLQLVRGPGPRTK